MRNSVRLAVAIIMTFSCPPLRAEDTVKEKTVYYEIRGATESEIRKQLNLARRELNDQEYDAATEWHVRWSYETRKRKELYSLRSFQTRTDIIYTLPKWKAPKDPSKELSEKWAAYVEALKKHEAGHKAIALEAAAEISRRTKEIESYPSRKELAEAMLDTATRILEEYRKKDRHYDWLTDHGASQRASFP
jgi:predicted secreted Zn-dependent protease